MLRGVAGGGLGGLISLVGGGKVGWKQGVQRREEADRGYRGVKEKKRGGQTQI